jgi:hypothetical protein
LDDDDDGWSDDAEDLCGTDKLLVCGENCGVENALTPWDYDDDCPAAVRRWTSAGWLASSMTASLSLSGVVTQSTRMTITMAGVTRRKLSAVQVQPTKRNCQ